MKTLVGKVYFYFFLLMLMLVTVVRLIGSTQPATLATLFTNPDGSPCQTPCLFGVRPGETTYEDALSLLRAHPFTADFDINPEWGVAKGPQVNVLLFTNDSNVVTRINLGHKVGAPRLSWGALGEVITVLGTPDMLNLSSETTQAYYLSGHLEFSFAQSEQQRVSPIDQFDSMFVFAKAPATPSSPTMWRGFRNMNDYKIHQRYRMNH
jgi:hypothetical protein